MRLNLPPNTRNLHSHAEVSWEHQPHYGTALTGVFISYWGLCRLLHRPSCPCVSGPFVCEVLEVINICFSSSVGEEDPADPLWPLLNPQRVEPVSSFPSLFFWVFTSEGAYPILTLVSDPRITWDPGYLMLTLSLELSYDDKFLYEGQWVFICRIPPPWNDLYVLLSRQVIYLYSDTPKKPDWKSFAWTCTFLGKQLSAAGCLSWSFLK